MVRRPARDALPVININCSTKNTLTSGIIVGVVSGIFTGIAVAVISYILIQAIGEFWALPDIMLVRQAPFNEKFDRVCPQHLSFGQNGMGTATFSVQFYNDGDNGLLAMNLFSNGNNISSRKYSTDDFTSNSTDILSINSKQYVNFKFEIKMNESIAQRDMNTNSYLDNFTMSFDFAHDCPNHILRCVKYYPTYHCAYQNVGASSPYYELANEYVG